MSWVKHVSSLALPGVATLAMVLSVLFPGAPSVSAAAGLHLSRLTAAANETIGVAGFGFSPGSALVYVDFDVQGSTHRVQTAISVAGNGAFSASFVVPAGTVPGTYAVTARDLHNNTAAQDLTILASVPEVVNQKPPTVTLAAGQYFYVFGTGYLPNETVTVTASFPLYNGATLTVNRVFHVDPHGEFGDLSLQVPVNARITTVTIAAQAHQSGRRAQANLAIVYHPQLSLSGSSAAPGGTVTVNGRGWIPSSAVRIAVTVSRAGATSVTLSKTVTADGNGTFSTPFTLPTTMSPGTYTFSAADAVGNLVARVAFTVAGHPAISLQPSTIAPGGTTTVRGAGFTANAGVTLSAVFPLYGGGSRTVSLTTRSNAGGAVAVHLAAPSNAASGAVTVDARGPNGTASAALHVGVVNAAVALSPTSVVPGSRVTVSGSGYPAGDHVAISVAVHLTNGTAATLTSTAVANAQGQFAVALSIPATVDGGIYDVVARSTSTGRAPAAHLTVVRLVPSIVAVPNTAVPGAQVTVNGFGFAPGLPVSVSLDGQTVGSGATNSIGQFSLKITVPANLASGSYSLLAQSADGRKTGPLTLSVIRQVSTHFYFASEYTGTGYTNYLAFLNPTAIAARVTLTYQRANGTTLVKTFSLSPHTRYTENVNTDLGPRVTAAAVVAADVPIVAEAAVYHGRDGAVMPGVTAPSTHWYFANGNTGHGYREYIAVQNPNPGPVQVALHLIPAHHRAVTIYHTMLPTSRTTFYVNKYLGSDAVGAVVTANVPVVANRTVFIHHGMTSKMGVTAPQHTWYFAAGPASRAASNWIGVLNPSSHWAYVTLRATGPYGGARATIHAWLKPNARVGYLINKVAHTPDVAVFLQAYAPVVAEQTTYVGALHNASTDTFGVPSPARSWAFALADTSANQSDTLTLFNPNALDEPIVVQFLSTSGQVVERTYTVGPFSQQDISVGSVMPNVQTGIVAASNYGFVALNRFSFNRGEGGDTSPGIPG